MVAFLDLRSYGQTRTLISAAALHILIQFNYQSLHLSRTAVTCTQQMQKIKSRLLWELLKPVLGFMESALALEGSAKLFTGRYSGVRESLSLQDPLLSAPGNILDWAYAVAGIKYSYAAHLRDTGTYGFLLPQEMIRPTGEEAAALVDYLATFISKDPKVCKFSNRKYRD